MKPDSSEVRAIPMEPCQPVTLTFDPSTNDLYIVCDDLREEKYYIRKKTFDGKIDEVIYNELCAILHVYFCHEIQGGRQIKVHQLE